MNMKSILVLSTVIGTCLITCVFAQDEKTKEPSGIKSGNQGPVEVPSFDELLKQMRRGHPRLFLNDDMWPDFQARATAGAEDYQAMQLKVKALPALADITIADWGKSLAPAAFVYRVDPSPELLAKILRMLQASLTFYQEILAEDNEPSVHIGAVGREELDYGFNRVSWLAALDWVWDSLSPDERQPLVNGMIDHMHAFMNRFGPDRLNLSLDSFNRNFYYWDNMLWYAGLVLYADALPPETKTKITGVFQRGYQDHQSMMTCRAEARGDDGGFSEWRAEYFLPSWVHAEWSFFHSWKAAVNPRLPDAWIESAALYANGVFWNVINDSFPNVRHFGMAESWHIRNWVRGDYVGANLCQYLHFFGNSHPDHAALAGFLWEKLDYRTKVKYGHVPLAGDLWTPMQQQSWTLPANLPMARHMEANGMIYFRSGHTAEDTYVGFYTGGGKYGTGNKDGLQFGIYRKGVLALDSGTRNSPDHFANYSTKGIAHNTILIGPKSFPRNARGNQVLAFETNALYSYAAADGTQAYDPKNATQVTRQLVFLPPEHVVIFDRVTATNAADEKRWLFHTANEPIVTGREFQADQADGRIFVRTLLPQTPVLEKIGGPGREFWYLGRNWPLDTDWWDKFGHLYGGVADGEIPEEMGRWRMEVKTSGSLEDNFLVLIQVGDQSLSRMVASQLVDSGNDAGVEFTSSGRTFRVLFNKTGTVGGHIEIGESGRPLIDQHLATRVQKQAGLALTIGESVGARGRQED